LISNENINFENYKKHTIFLYLPSYHHSRVFLMFQQFKFYFYMVH